MNRILVIHAGALGDLVNTLPAIRAVRGNFPAVSITAVGNLTWLKVLKAAGVIEVAISLERAGFHALFNEAPLTDSLREIFSGYELAFSYVRSAVLIGHLTELGLPVSVLDGPFPPPPGSSHVTEYLARPVLARGIPVRDFHPRLSLPPEVLPSSPRFPGIIAHPGSGSPKKNWPAPRFAEAAKLLARKTGQKIAVLEGPADQESAQELKRELGPDLKEHFHDLSGLELAGLLAGAALFLGNDSGVSHLAGAVGAPVVALFGPTDPQIWGVRQESAVNLSAQLPCSPCSREVMKECAERKCLQMIGVDAVVEAARRIM